MKKKPLFTRQRGLIALGVLLAAGGIWLGTRDRPAPADEGVGPAVTQPAARAEWDTDRPLKVLPVLAEKPSKEELTEEALKRATKDPEGAVVWAHSLGEPADRETALLAVASERVRENPKHALELGLELSASESRDELLERATREWAGQDPHAAVEWAKTLPESTLRQRLIGGAVLEWSQTEPREAAALAIDTLDPGRPLENLIVGIVQRWVQTEPEEASAWVAQIPDGPLKHAAEANHAAIKAAPAAQAEERRE
jgi:hypothetical protein